MLPIHMYATDQCKNSVCGTKGTSNTSTNTMNGGQSIPLNANFHRDTLQTFYDDPKYETKKSDYYTDEPLSKNPP